MQLRCGENLVDSCFTIPNCSALWYNQGMAHSMLEALWRVQDLLRLPEVNADCLAVAFSSFASLIAFAIGLKLGDRLYTVKNVLLFHLFVYVALCLFSLKFYGYWFFF